VRNATRNHVRWLMALGAGLVAGVTLLLALWAGPVGAEAPRDRRETPQGQTAARTQQDSSSLVRATGAVVGMRVIVVDERGAIVAVYSNTRDAEAPIEVRLGNASGPTLDATASLMRQYGTLETRVDWSRTGLVYQRQ